jgi:hypothetical protein
LCNKLNNYTHPGNVARGIRPLPRFFLYFLMLSLLPASRSLCADLPELYGEMFSRLGQDWAEVRPPVVEPLPVVESPDPDKAFQLQLEEFESNRGPYADGLAEPLLGLGRYFARSGNYEQALQLYRRALHVVRLNDGLNSERQIPVVRELLETIRLSGNLPALDDRYDYFFRLYGRGQPPYTDIRVRATLEYLRWQREALRLDIDTKGSRRLLELYELNEDMLEAAAGSVSFTLEDRWKLALGQVQNLYLLQSKVSPPIYVSGSNANSAMSPRLGPGQDLELDSTQRQLETLRANAFRAGRAVLDEFLASIQVVGEGSEQAEKAMQLRARATLELADWYQWNGGYSRAVEYYTGVVEILIADDTGELLQQWFGEPVELPDNGVFWDPTLSLAGAQQIIVSATYDVSARGRVRNVQARPQREDGEKKLYRFKRRLAATRFRPRFENGQAVATQTLSREYVLYN